MGQSSHQGRVDKIPEFQTSATMKRIHLAMLGVVLTAGLQAQNPSYTDEQVLKAISTRTGGEIESTEYFRVAPPEEAWTAFGYLSQWAAYYNKIDLAKRAGGAIAENPEVEKYVTEGMAKLPHDFYNAGERGRFLYPLGDVPAPWALRMLGHYLTDETPMTVIGEHPDYDASPNQDMAITGLFRMGFSDAPKEDKKYGYTPTVEKGWRDWWKANENRVEERVREINPGYYPPPQVSATATPKAVPTATLVATNESPAPPPMITSKPNPTIKPHPTATLKQSNDWMLYLGAGAILLIVGGIIAGTLLRRK